MKNNISIIFNILLTIALGIVLLGYKVQNHYYRDFTGRILRKSAEQVEAGHSDLVVQVLGSVKGHPTYGDLLSILDHLYLRDPKTASSDNAKDSN